MGKKLNIAGERYGALVALYDTGQKINGATAWMFQCDCGNKKMLPINNVRYGAIKSCGCYINKKLPKKRKQRVQVGDVFGELIVVQVMGQSDNDAHYQSKVRCTCGNVFTTRDTFLICGKRTCCPQCSNLKQQTHGLSDTPIFHLWQGMKSRCNNPNDKQYKDYGGRGICVCDEWINNSDAFIEWAVQNGYKEGLQIDRKDVNGNYEPSNCRFITQVENARNRRNTIRIHYEGELMTIGEIAEITGLESTLIYQRIHKFHWDEYDATHVIPDAHNYTSKQMRETTLRDISTGKEYYFNSCSKASRFLGEKSSYLLGVSYNHGNKFTCKNFMVEISDNNQRSNDEKE